jgi:hopanoid-associated phosphorylase
MTILAVVGLKREARIVEGPGVRCVIGGGNSDLLARRLSAAFDPDVLSVISVGIGGALDPTLKVGDVVVGASVVWPDDGCETDPAWRARLAAALPSARIAPIYGAEAMVLSPPEKARLHAAGGAVAVDMESRAAARFCRERALPFAVLRTVSDTAQTTLPPAVLAGMSSDGGMNLPGVLAALARRPGQLAALIRTGADADRAFKALARAWAAAGRIRPA